MTASRILYLFVTITFFVSCKESSIYSNNSESLQLELKKNSEYVFRIPTFFNAHKEKGTYRLSNDSIILLRVADYKIDSVDISYTCWKDNPDSLVLTFNNLYGQEVKTKVLINNSPQEFHANDKGYIYLSYNELENKNVIVKDGRLKNIKIVYGNKEYLYDMRTYENSRKPDRLDFKLNQFVGEKATILKRQYLINNDTIFTNDIQRKVIGADDKLVRRQ
ncbi:MAG: hypothetical protein K0R51_2543 [Cytophagaceae bacterium]|jgi:hypothetical protein|nr:hypothetical protein [Cytophagaceae bacterium]